ncbi:PHR1 [Candida pseudojiufengensis]|uniref:PHR1 n=1 Tax=Candida pseudojiufengensis TaxID=497109 RepID=UPI00222487ED|nr:PHR1 [Candida pseudojiufengensis]KAI5965803.1 PHR1 [Candida pseudojiufengensis]
MFSNSKLFFSSFTILLSFLISTTNAKFEDLTPPIEIIGNKFFYSNNGSQFLMRGIAYQEDTSQLSNTNLTYKDPLADIESCRRDVEYFKDLNTNCLRIYAIDPNLDHDECMELLAEAGIYIVADLSQPMTSINRNEPDWNLDHYDRYTRVVDKLSEYSNVLGFFAGNEVTNNRSNTDASPFVKAAVRDIKKYIDEQDDMRKIPVGYSSNDDEDTRIAIADYFACGSIEERADFFGINMYEWCGNSTYEESGYQDRTEEFEHLPIPLFFSEYGCNVNRPRLFTEVGTLYSPQMSNIWSGGIVYMYFEEENQYGLVSISNNRVVTLDDYNYYSSEINNISPSYARASDESTQSSTLTCPGNQMSTWRASPTLPPTPNEEFCECIANSLNCVVDDDIDEEDYGDLFSTVCGLIDCSEINVDGIEGEYGEYSYCSNKDKLSYVLNLYYEDQGSVRSACDFDGSASINGNALADQTCSVQTRSRTSNSSSSSSGSNSESTNEGSRSNLGNSNVERLSSYKVFGLVALITAFVGGFSIIF